MNLCSLQDLPFYHINNSQLIALFDDNLKISPTQPPTSLATGTPVTSHSYNTNKFEIFLEEQDDLKFYNLCQYFSPNDMLQNTQPQYSSLIIHINARSVPKNFNNLKLLIGELQTPQ
jgi:hypothetical protein